MPAVATTLDPDGHRVVLAETRWLHIKRRHPDMTRRLHTIMLAVRDPERRMRGRSENEQWFFHRIDGRLPWLHVVVHYEGGEGWITTAFRRASLPAR